MAKQVVRGDCESCSMSDKKCIMFVVKGQPACCKYCNHNLIKGI